MDKNSILNLPPPGTRARIMVITKSESYDHVLSFLRRRNYDLAIAQTPFLAVKLAQTFKPHVVLLSWNTQNVGRMCEFFTKTMKAICIVFAETTGRKTAAALSSSGFPNTMMAPITGPGTHMRIQALMRKKSTQLKSKKKTKKTVDASKMEIPVDSLERIPPETTWEQKADPLKSEIIWQGLHTDSSGKSSTYHFSGTTVPKYNASTKSWEGLDLKYLSQVNIEPTDFFEQSLGSSFESDSIVQEEESGDSELSQFEDALSQEPGNKLDETNQLEEDDPLYNADDPYQHDAKSLASTVTALHKTQNSRKVSILAHHTRGVLESLVTPEKTQPEPIGIVDFVAVATVESAHFRGYLVCNNSKGFSAVELMDKVFEILKDKMTISNEPMRKITKTLVLECKPIDFMNWAKENAEFYVTSQQGLSSLAVAYVPVEAIPEILETTKEDIVKVNLETDILGDTKILFDIYIFMEKNNKYIKYIRKNTVITQDVIDKLLNFGITYIYVRKSETQLLHSYWASIRIFDVA